MILLYIAIIYLMGPMALVLVSVFALALFAVGTSAFWLNRPLGQARRAVLPMDRDEVATERRLPGDWRSLRRWHIVAACFALGAPVVQALELAYAGLGSPGCGSPDMFYSCVTTGALFELKLAFLLGSIPFALLYLNRLYRSGFRYAPILAFGVWAIPRSLLVVVGFGDGTGIYVIALTAVGGALILLGVLLPGVRAKFGALGVGCIAMLSGLVMAIHSEPGLFMVDGVLSALSIGFGISLIVRRATRGSTQAAESGWRSSFVKLAWAMPFLVTAVWSVVFPLTISDAADSPAVVAGSDWLAWVAGTALTGSVLWLAWYVFGPGRRWFATTS